MLLASKLNNNIHSDFTQLLKSIVMISRTLRIGFVAVSVTVAALLTSHISMAQGVDSTAKKIGNKTASVAVKGAMKITDKTYKGKEGPGGQTVYIDKKDRKYYVDDKGKKVYLKPSEIRDKQDN